jgi:hypothetical protein
MYGERPSINETPRGIVKVNGQDDVALALTL